MCWANQSSNNSDFLSWVSRIANSEIVKKMRSPSHTFCRRTWSVMGNSYSTVEVHLPSLPDFGSLALCQTLTGGIGGLLVLCAIVRAAVWCFRSRRRYNVKHTHVFLWFRKQFAVLVELLPHTRREEILAFYELVLFSSSTLLCIQICTSSCGAMNIDLSGGEDGPIGPWWPCGPMEQKGWEAFSRRCQDSQVGQIWPKVIITVFSGTSLWWSSTGSAWTGLTRALLMHVR